MKLTQLSSKSADKMNKFVESRFGFSIDFDKLSVSQAEKLSETIGKNLQKIRRSSDFHTAETNPRYMELLTVQESLSQWLLENHQQLNEGDVGDAEVLLAAKDMVDSVQDVIEKVGKMQYEQLPQLADSIRDEIGSAQAEQFKTETDGALSGLLDQLNSVREQLNNGVRMLSGEQVEQPMAIGSDDLGDLGDLDDEGDGFATSDAAAGGDVELGRELR